MATAGEKLEHCSPATRVRSAAKQETNRTSASGVPSIIHEFLAGYGPTPVPLTADQYLAAIRAEIFPEKAPIELIDGFLLHKDRRDGGGDLMTEGDRHYLVKNLLRDVLDPLVRPYGFHAVTEPPLLLSTLAVPEPDIAVFRGRLLDYRGRLPQPADAAVLIEVAWSSLIHDRVTKLERYAAAGVPTYWIVNLASSEIEVYSRADAANSRYSELRTYGRNAVIPLPLFDAATVDVSVAEFLPE